MGFALTDWFLRLGIRAGESAQEIATFAGAMPLQWPAGQRGSLVYRLPRDPHQRASIFSTTQLLLVNEGEAAVVLLDGVSGGALPAGRYIFHKQSLTGVLDVVWVVTGQQTIKWGLGNVTSTDGIQISANGVLYTKVQDARAFNQEVVQGAITLAEIDLQRFVMPRVQGVLRSTIARFPALELQTQRETFTDTVRRALGESLAAMGLGVVDFEVVEINFPPEFKAAIAQATLVTHGSKAQLIQAQTDAQVRQMQAIAEASALLATGTANNQLLAQLQAQGIDPLKMKALEALKEYADHPAQGMFADPGKAQLFAQVTTAALAPNMAPAPMVTPPAPPQPPSLPGPAAATPAAESGTMTAADIERQIDALTERLAEGKITEETYNKLVARLEAKLEKLK